MINCYLTFLLIDYHINDSSLYLLTLISTTFSAAFIGTLIIKVKYYHWVISLVILYIIIRTFRLRPTDGLYYGALIVQFITIFISEFVGFVFSEIIKHIYNKKTRATQESNLTEKTEQTGSSHCSKNQD